MDEEGPTATIILFCVLLFMDVMIYGFLKAISVINKSVLDDKAEEENNKKAKLLLRMIEDREALENTVAFIMMTLNIFAGAVYLVSWKYDYITVLRLIVMVFALLVFGVLVPQRAALRSPEKWANFFIYPIWVLYLCMKPFTKAAFYLVQGIFYMFGIKDKKEEEDILEDEIISMVQEGHEQGLIEESEAQMISNVISYKDKEAQDIMTHRNQIVAIDAQITMEEAVAFMLSENFSRYPVFMDSIDNIIGILHLKDILRFCKNAEAGNRRLAEFPQLLRDTYVVPLTRNIDELFHEMQNRKLQMVIAVDEYGQIAGLIAMEDILEEIVGNILDEYDEEVQNIEEKGGNQYLLNGSTPLAEIKERFGLDFNQEEFETLNGFLISKMDKIPEPDCDFSMDYEGYRFQVKSVDKKRISQVLLTKLLE